MNITREELLKEKIKILENIISEEEFDKIKEMIKKEVDDIISDFNNNDEGVLDE